MTMEDLKFSIQGHLMDKMYVICRHCMPESLHDVAQIMKTNTFIRVGQKEQTLLKMSLSMSEWKAIKN